MRENSYQALILKKQPYNEGDEIVTFFTREIGKVRGLAKSSKLAKSKLQYSLQSLFLVNIRMTTKGLAQIIGAEVDNSFANIRENFQAIKIAYYAVELMLKFTADEQKNEPLFTLGIDFFSFLNRQSASSPLLAAGLAKFKIDFLETLGLGISVYGDPDLGSVAFSNSRGSFLFGSSSVDAMPVALYSFSNFNSLRNTSFAELTREEQSLEYLDIGELQQLLSHFVTYQLERDVKSERYLNL